MNQYLILIALGPVQDFIMTARSSGDLWFGSNLLSECSKAVAKVVAEIENDHNALIFPAPNKIEDLHTKSVLNVANVIFARIQTAPETVASQARDAIRLTIQGYWKHVLKTMPDNILTNVAEQQLEDFIEFYWASTPLTDYVASRNRVYALLNARKTNRDFQAVIWGADKPKSSLDGARESVIPETEYPKPGTSAAQRQQIAKRLFRRYGVRIGERLCAIGLLKRRAMLRQRPGFSSTSHMAVQPLLDRTILHLDKAKKHLQELESQIGESDLLERLAHGNHVLLGNLDGRILLPERMRELFEDKNQLEEAKKSVQAILQAAYGVSEAPAYYALLHADGDRMGKAIDQQNTWEAHQTLSRKLAGFAELAKKTIREHGGCPVFVGGDDVLAYLPVHRALECTQVLAKLFAETLHDYEITEDQSIKKPTLSAGLVIAHYLEPLQDTLEAARVAEKIAKKTRNALAITLLKRSGVPITITGHWDEFILRLQHFRDMHRRDLFPDGAAYELRQLAFTLEQQNTPAMQQAAKSEAKRILQRKRPKLGTASLDEKIITDVLQTLEQPNNTVASIANELIVTRELAKAYNTAQLAVQEQT